MTLDKTHIRDLLVDGGAMVIRRLEAIIAWGSLVGNPPVFDSSLFPWARQIEENWQSIRSELDEVMKDEADIPPFQEISRDQRRLTDDDRWKTYFFYAFGFKAERNCARCPETTRLIETIPGMTTAFFSMLAPGKHLPDHRGAFKGIIRYHLGLRIPEPKDASGIRVGGQVCHWREGESLVFDDTYRHEAWNDTDQTRVVLFVDCMRPLRFPANLVNRLTIAAIKHSPFVKDGIANYQAWEAKLDHVG
jgi:aspartyl/asparaginyl beta-hydroxylase (cupin superfamily)